MALQAFLGAFGKKLGEELETTVSELRQCWSAFSSSHLCPDYISGACTSIATGADSLMCLHCNYTVQ